ncbi:NAD(P)H-dependent oxidoreductase [Sphingomonas aracearum]|uniref:NAD(P)-dependent oxidoreductase n=1 Tax=Sphingomonas aracearum TaxID=2283317 RepID=A0A369VZ09_9SPHN|nr:Gfo/Idh/MocA family oxidoreductase [Sphingomonas aracearum]RDE06292.1 NAD(P)-dependent oxidoreductase [Sphingomonas aracearum]
MILVDSALARREAEGRPVRVGIVGAGFQGAGIVRQIMCSTPGMRVAAVASRDIEKAAEAVTSCDGSVVRCSGRRAVEAALGRDAVAITEDAEALAVADGIDVVVEVTGSVDHAAHVVLAAIGAGKHVVQMNAELDGTLGPILNAYARRAGVIYTFSDGDQPGVQMNLVRFVRGIGVTPVLCGNIKGLHDPKRNPATQRAFAEKWGQKPAMVASFADGTKISFEQAVVANGTGFRVARRGMLGPDFSGGDPTAPLVPLEQTMEPLAEGLREHGEGLVDYVVGARPGPGVFVLGRHDDPRQQHFLNLYKLGSGPYYCFHTPYHLCHFEVPMSVARAALFHDAVLSPIGAPQVGVIAMAKKALVPGEVIAEFGGFEAYGVAENQDVIERENLLPMGIALGCTVVRPVAADAPLTYADVSVPRGRLVDRLYAEQQAMFAPRELAA